MPAPFTEHGTTVTAPTGSPVYAGGYWVSDAFASGGMGSVHFGYAARDARRVVAVKRLHPHLRKDATFSTLILDEARLATSVRHPNVVSVIDVVSTEEELLLVMEYVPGLSLHELMRAVPSEPVPFDIAVPIAIDALRGLHAAHEAVGPDGTPLGLVHRDVSPQNLLVSVDGRTKLTDFGIAKAAGRLQSTRDGSLKGKIAYMSPEQLSNVVQLDARSDVYATAVVLWELLTGQRLFDAENDLALIGKAMRGPTKRVSDIVPNVPRGLDAAIWRALSRDPGRRYPSALAFANALVESVGEGDPRAVAQWVFARGRPELESRGRIVDRILRDVALASSSRVPAYAAALPPAAPTAKGAHLRTVAVALAFILLLGSTLAVVVVSRSNARSAPAREQGWAPPIVPTSPTVTVATVEPTPAPELPVVAPEPVPAPGATSSARALSPSRGKQAPPRRAAPEAKRDCDPPYSIDTNGDKHFKTECLR